MMGERRTRTTRGTDARGRIIEAACAVLRREGLAKVSMRAVAKEASVPLGSLQFHYGSQDDFLRAVIRGWAAEVTEELARAAGDTRGLARTLELADAWLRCPDLHLISGASARMPASREGRDGPGALFVSVLGRWVDETHKALRQARYKNELKPGLDLRAIAVELHRLIWSHGWSSALDGAEASAGQILHSVWDRLAAIALDPDHSLPPLGPLLAIRPGDLAPARRQPLEDPVDYRAPLRPLWQLLLHPGEALWHAFERHQLMGEELSFAHPPPVLPTDHAEAEAYLAAHPEAPRPPT